MGAKTWMLAYVDGDASCILRSKPALNRQASAELCRQLFPSAKLVPIEDGTLWDTSPPTEEIYAGCFPGLSIVAAGEFAVDYPSKLPPEYLEPAAGRSVYLHAMHSVVDWFAYAVWKNGRLVRSLSVSPDDGVLEDIGQRLPFEEPYWSGQHPAIDPEEEDVDYPFPFHPLELGEAALLALFGYQLEGVIDPAQLDPETIPLVRYKRKRSFWRV